MNKNITPASRGAPLQADTSKGMGSFGKAEVSGIWSYLGGGFPRGGDTPLALPWTEECLNIRRRERASKAVRMA